MTEKIYKEHKEIVAFIKVDKTNKNLEIDINEERISVKDFLYYMNTLIGEFIDSTEVHENETKSINK